MADSYLAIAAIANDEFMVARLNACASQQAQNEGMAGLLSIGNDPLLWVQAKRFTWAASPSWGEKWHQAYADHPDDDAYEPGKDPDVITDGDILSTVQSLAS